MHPQACTRLTGLARLTSLYVYLTAPLARPALRVVRGGGFVPRRLRSLGGRCPLSSACSFSAYASSAISTAAQSHPLRWSATKLFLNFENSLACLASVMACYA